MQEERRLIEQPLRRFDALDHNAAGQRVQARVLFRRQFFAGEDHDWQIAQLAEVSRMRSRTVEAGHVRQSQIEHDAIECFLRHDLQRFRAGRDNGDIDIVVSQQFANAHLFRGIVFHDQQPLAAWGGIFFDARQRRRRVLRACRLGDKGKGAASQAVVTILVQA